MLRKTISITGREAAVLFYNPEYFQRNGATPMRIQKTLFGRNGVQTLDGSAHRRRKAMFMSLMTTGQIDYFIDVLIAEWQRKLLQWYRNGNPVDLFTEAQDVLCRAACAWAGVPLAEEDVRRRADDMHKMVSAFGALGPRHWRGRAARRQSEHWAAQLVKGIRSGKLYAGRTSAASVIARHIDIDGKYLPLNVAAVELLNIIRPIVAIARYITFIMLALQERPAYRANLCDDEQQAAIFVHEVRRFYPFTPFLGALTRKEFNWRGYHFPQNTRVVLDVYGINHDPRIWYRPEEFMPERFLGWQQNAYNFIPQGGGDFLHGHRCAGEWITVQAMKVSAMILSAFLTRQLSEQELSFDIHKMPTAPDRGVILEFPGIE